MTTRQWYKRYPSAFIEGTMGMTLEQKGAYSIILDLIYSNGGPVPDDARWLSGVCGVTVRKWKSLREYLIGREKIFVIGDRLSNARAEREIEALDDAAEMARVTGSAGGKKSAKTRSNFAKSKLSSSFSEKQKEKLSEKHIDTNEINNLGEGTIKLIEIEIEKEKKVSTPLPPKGEKQGENDLSSQDMGNGKSYTTAAGVQLPAPGVTARPGGISGAGRWPDDAIVPDDWIDAARDRREQLGLPPIDMALRAEEFCNYWPTLAGRAGIRRDWRKVWIGWAINGKANGNGNGNGNGNDGRSRDRRARDEFYRGADQAAIDADLRYENQPQGGSSSEKSLDLWNG